MGESERNGVLSLRHIVPGGTLMDVVYDRCAGLDVHKRNVVACMVRTGENGSPVLRTRTFTTMVTGLTQLRAWLREEGCSHAAMEATGVYWKPVVNVLEQDPALTVLVVNAEHIKAVPGRKTDVKDAEWIASLLRHGLLRGSFIPDREQRELRELVRFRTALLRDRSRAVNRLQKTLEGANLKLAAVLTDITGKSGERILTALLRGEDDPATLADLADQRVLSSKRAALEQALAGQLSPTLHFVLQQELDQLQRLDDQIAACDAEVARHLAPFEGVLLRLDAIPGVGRRTAEVVLAELGMDLTRWPTGRHLAAWAGLAPGNKESGGKRRRARTRRGNPWLKAALTQAGWAAGRTKTSYLGQAYRRLAARLGRKRAVVALAHEIVLIIYAMLTRGTDYQDLGLDYWDQRYAARRQQRAVQYLTGLGYTVSAPPEPEAA